MAETNRLQPATKVLYEDDGVRMIQHSDADGKYDAIVYQVMPGIYFTYHEIHRRSARFIERETTSDNIVEICHCRQGRMENYINGRYKYLAKGDMAIVRTNSIGATSYFPVQHFHGVIIFIDVKEMPESRSELLQGLSVRPREIISKFCNENDSFVAPATPALEKYFQDLYNLPVSDHMAYFKVKILELMLLLDATDPTQQAAEQQYSVSQVELAKEISRYMLANKDDRITLEQLSARFGKSTAYIKTAFKAVYGVPVGAYLRTLKMESAAYMLEYTDKSILDIANEHGYDNGSKFASAFRSVKGVNPTEYRAAVSKNK